MQHRLLWKLLSIQTVLVAGVVIVLAVSIHLLSINQLLSPVQDRAASNEPSDGIYFDFMDRYFLGASVTVGVLSLGISFVVTRRILLPLSRLAIMARRISTGNYSARVRPARRGEFAQVTSAFNQMAASLQRTDDLRRSLVSNVAHELRTPLTNIRGYLEALQDGVVPPSVATYRTLHDETLRVVHLVDDLVRLARADAANTDMTVEEIDLDQLLKQVIQLFELRIDSKNIDVQVHTEALRVPITADRLKLTQVLTNLLDNACRYTPAGRQLGLIGERKDGQVKLVCSNPCSPITEEERELLFERFYRREKSRSRELGGAGIGLAIVKELVEAHGGSVGVDSQDSTISVWFSIPCHVQVHGKSAMDKKDNQPPAGETKPPSVQPGQLHRQHPSPVTRCPDPVIRIGDSAGMRMVIPVGRSVWAVLAGYLGLFSVLLFPAPFAVLTGLLAIRELRRQPSKHGMGRAIFGIVCGSLGMGLAVVFFSSGMRL